MQRDLEEPILVLIQNTAQFPSHCFNVLSHINFTDAQMPVVVS